MNKKLYNLTNPQKSIWLTEQYYQNTNVNNICGTAIIDNVLDFENMKKAINCVVKNNDSFRLHFIQNENSIQQYVSPFHELDIEIIDIKNKNEIANIEKNVLQKHFSLFDSDLFEFKIFRLENGTGGFLLNIHHLISDAWTLGLVCRKIMREYSIIQNDISNDSEQNVSYLDLLNTENIYISGNRYEKDKQYWEKKFSTVPNIITLPSSKINSSEFSCHGTRELFSISIEKMNMIKTFCSNHKISVFNFFMSILSIYLYKLTNIDDFVIGTPILNRSTFNEKNTTGMFVNVVPLRISVEKFDDFKSFIADISKNTMELLRHQKYPYENILDLLRTKDSTIPNLYNIILSYQVTRANNESNYNYTTRWTFNGNSADDLDIQLYDLDEDGILNIAYDYKTEKYTSQDIHELHYRLMHIVDQVIQNASIEISKLQIITEVEKQELLGFNNTKLEYDKTVPVIQYFEKQAEENPNNIAITFKNKHITYQELNEKANSLAYFLRNNGVTNNTIVALMVNRSIEMLVGILAILKSGGAYLPIDPEYPKDRISYMIKESKIETLLSHQNLAKDINCNKIISIDLNNPLYENHKENIDNISNPEDLSYIIYTSGSTGAPKGVMLTQKNYSNFYHAMLDKIKYLKNGSKYSIVSITTVSFDIFAFETIISLTRGLHVYLTDYFEQKYTDYLSHLIAENKIDIIQSTPSVMRFHLDNAKNQPDFSKLKYVILAGEQLPKDLVEKIKNIAPNVTVINGYGPSETTIFSSVQDVTNLEEITIGKPIANTQFYILDKNMNLLPKNTVGDIYIGGDGVGNGYLYKENLTHERFLSNPYGSGVIYKTGDLGLWLNNGMISCKGRSDHQIKIRGLRVELDEIENKINKFKSEYKIKSVVVLKGTSTTAYLHAFISSNYEIDLKELKAYLLKNLPNYMVPSTYSFIENFPSTPNGKIDRKALLNINVEEISKNIVLPTNNTEQIIFDEIKKIANSVDFGIEDDFFSIGLDSLKIINLSLNLNEKLKKKLSISDFYHFINIKNLAAYIDQTFVEDLPQMTHAKKVDFCPVSSAQERIFYAQKLNEDSTTYNVCGGFIIHKHIGKSKIQSIFETLIKRHSAFRTSFKWNNNELVQVVTDNVELNIEFKQTDKINVQKTIDKFAKPFSLESAPLLRVEVHFIENHTTLVLIDTHHIVVDGTSLSILINEFIKLLQKEPLEPVDFTYTDYAVWENKFKNTEKYKSLENYWQEQFKDQEIPVINLPYDFPISQKKDSVGDIISKCIDKNIFNDLEALSQELNTTPYALFMSAFYILLYKYTSQNEIILGSPTASREFSQTQNIIGMFVNNMVLKNKINPADSVEDFVKQTKALITNTLAHQPYPYEQLSRKFNNSFFDVMFTYQNQLVTKNDLLDVKFANTKTSKFTLSLEVIPESQTLNLEYNTSLFKPETIENMLNHYTNILKEIIINPNQHIENISMLDIAEKNKILYEFNDTKLEYPVNKTIAELIEERAQKIPNHIAITFGDSSLTFKELNEKSNQLAHYLRSLGISRNDIIGIMIERGLELIVAMLAVLKSGACYIPIDPSYPKNRVSYMLNNSNAKLLILTEQTSPKIEYENKFILNINALSNICSDISPLRTITAPDDNSYIIYTSGSTGTPKGVVLKQKSLTNLTYYLNNYVEFLKKPSKNECMASVTTASFDIFLFETFICLQKGITVAIANNDEQVLPKQLDNLIVKNHVTAIQMTPSRMQLFIDNIKDIPHLKQVKYVTLAGEPLPNSLLAQLKNLGVKKVYNGYGPSETTVFSTFTNVTDYKDITIGKPLSNTYTYILDQNLHPVPINVPGELYISGDGVGNGYLNKEALTNASFISNPFIPGKLMYKTGDLCKFLPNGELYYIGRVDNQIKIRGLRIELDEIENKILTFPFIKKVKVVKQTVNEREFLSAYFIAEKHINIANLRNYLLEFLPNYMIPTYFTPLDAFPYTPNGKIDKNALPLPKSNLKELTKKYIAPETDLEIKLVKIFEDILNTKPIGIDDDFFELGGDSILAMKLNIELLNIDNTIKYSDIFSNSTVRKLINFMAHSENNSEKQSINLPNQNSFSKILKHNEKMPKVLHELKNQNVLLTGATGFLGAHILSSLLDHTDYTVYCLIRKEPGISAQNKLKDKLHYYFKTKYDSFINDRIKIIEGDITELDLSNLSDTIDIVINSAAKVSHFGKYEEFYNINVHGTQSLAEFCYQYHKKFYQISTLSVSGNSFVDGYGNNQNFENDIDFSEDDFYIGQNLDNVYVRSKFEAEQIVLDKIENGLEGYILRVGNLMPRLLDGIFQENSDENAYINRLSAFLKLKVMPKNIKNAYLEFTPIDCCANAIVKIVTHPSKQNHIYHLFNHKHIYIDKLLKILKEYHYDIEILETKKFKELINTILHDAENKNILNHLINDFNQNLDLNYESKIKLKSDFTIEFLLNLGFEWPKIDKNYIGYILSILER